MPITILYTYKMQPSATTFSPEPITGKCLLHRSDSHFFILGTTGNVYTVTLTATSTCTCPDPATPCKHILFLYTHILSLSPDDPCVRRRTLRPCQLTRLLSTKVIGDCFVIAPIRRRFHELYNCTTFENVKKDMCDYTCPVCLEELVGGRRRVVACATCKNSIHVVCLMGWKSKGSRTCVICKARWRDNGEKDKYINLSVYVSGDKDVAKNIVGINVN